MLERIHVRDHDAAPITYDMIPAYQETIDGYFSRLLKWKESLEVSGESIVYSGIASAPLFVAKMRLEDDFEYRERLEIKWSQMKYQTEAAVERLSALQKQMLEKHRDIEILQAWAAGGQLQISELSENVRTTIQLLVHRKETRKCYNTRELLSFETDLNREFEGAVALESYIDQTATFLVTSLEPVVGLANEETLQKIIEMHQVEYDRMKTNHDQDAGALADHVEDVMVLEQFIETLSEK